VTKHQTPNPHQNLAQNGTVLTTVAQTVRLLGGRHSFPLNSTEGRGDPDCPSVVRKLWGSTGGLNKMQENFPHCRPFERFLPPCPPDHNRPRGDRLSPSSRLPPPGGWQRGNGKWDMARGGRGGLHRRWGERWGEVRGRNVERAKSTLVKGGVSTLATHDPHPLPPSTTMTFYGGM